MARVTHISTVQILTIFAKHRVKRQVDWTRCVRVDFRYARFSDFNEHMQERVVQIQVEIIWTINCKFKTIPGWIVASEA